MSAFSFRSQKYYVQKRGNSFIVTKCFLSFHKYNRKFLNQKWYIQGIISPQSTIKACNNYYDMKCVYKYISRGNIQIQKKLTMFCQKDKIYFRKDRSLRLPSSFRFEETFLLKCTYRPANERVSTLLNIARASWSAKSLVVRTSRLFIRLTRCRLFPIRFW